jgi:hypothetical protein
MDSQWLEIIWRGAREREKERVVRPDSVSECVGNVVPTTTIKTFPNQKP